VGILKDSSLMGTFPIPPLDVPHPFSSSINMISTNVGETSESYDPWIVPRLEECLRYGNQMPLSPVELAYQDIQSESPSPHSLFDMSPNPFHTIFPTDEMIMEIMSMEDTPWDEDITVLFSSSNLRFSRVINGFRVCLHVLLFLQFLNQHVMFYMKGTWEIFHPPSL
jgi:hypothetical protein